VLKKEKGFVAAIDCGLVSEY